MSAHRAFARLGGDKEYGLCNGPVERHLASEWFWGDSGRRIQQLTGTPAYLSPVRAEMTPDASGDMAARSDIHRLIHRKSFPPFLL